MRVRSTITLLALLAVPALAVLPSCAGQDQDDGNILENDNSANDVGSDDANDSNNSGDDDNEGTNETGSQINNDTSAEEGTLQDEAAPPVNTATNAGPDAVPAPGLNNATAAPAKAAPAAPSDAAPVPGGRVRYAKQAGVQVVSSPKGGTPVRTLEMGDHPVTWEENGFLKLANGMYVPVDAMSDKGVARTAVSQRK